MSPSTRRNEAGSSRSRGATRDRAERKHQTSTSGLESEEERSEVEGRIERGRTRGRTKAAVYDDYSDEADFDPETEQLKYNRRTLRNRYDFMPSCD
jgi:hypothetical protein